LSVTYFIEIHVALLFPSPSHTCHEIKSETNSLNEILSCHLMVSGTRFQLALSGSDMLGALSYRAFWDQALSVESFYELFKALILKVASSLLRA
jgi:hypothetical protein